MEPYERFQALPLDMTSYPPSRERKLMSRIDRCLYEFAGCGLAGGVLIRFADKLSGPIGRGLGELNPGQPVMYRVVVAMGVLLLVASVLNFVLMGLLIGLSFNHEGNDEQASGKGNINPFSKNGR